MRLLAGPMQKKPLQYYKSVDYRKMVMEQMFHLNQAQVSHDSHSKEYLSMLEKVTENMIAPSEKL